MLLTITTTHRPATDLGYLLHKNPARPQAFELSFGTARVFYPEASDAAAPRRCCWRSIRSGWSATAAGRRARGSRWSSTSTTGLTRPARFCPWRSPRSSARRCRAPARSGRNWRQTPIPLTARLSVVPCRGGEALLRKLFEPLGYAVAATHHPLDEQFPEWGEGPYFTVELSPHDHAARPAHAPVRADPRAGQRQALLDRRRRGAEAAAPRRAVAGAAPGEGADRPPVPQALQAPGRRGPGPPDRSRPR